MVPEGDVVVVVVVEEGGGGVVEGVGISVGRGAKLPVLSKMPKPVCGRLLLGACEEREIGGDVAGMVF